MDVRQSGGRQPERPPDEPPGENEDVLTTEPGRPTPVAEVRAMDIVHAISKVRFASARPQVVHLTRSDGYFVDLLCMEAGQQAKVTSGPWTYYVVMGTAKLSGANGSGELSSGQMATTGADEVHTVANAGEGRLVCLVIGSESGR